MRRAPNSAAAGEAFKPHQAFVRAVHAASSAVATFRCKVTPLPRMPSNRACALMLHGSIGCAVGLRSQCERSAALSATDLDSTVAHAQAGEAGVHRAAFTAAEIAVQADGRGGLYDLALLVGDAAVANPIEWRLGQVSPVTLVPSSAQQQVHLCHGPAWRVGSSVGTGVLADPSTTCLRSESPHSCCRLRHNRGKV